MHARSHQRGPRASAGGPLRWAALAVVVATLLLPPRFSGRGRVVAIDREAGVVTVDHRPIPGLMDAMRMRLEADDGVSLDGIAPGDGVGFALRFADVGVAVSSLWLDRAAARVATDDEQRLGHHHRSQHGGVVGMSGLYHLETLITEDGMLRVYPSDLERRPIPIADVADGARALLDDGERVLELAPRSTPTGAALEARLPDPSAAQVTAAVELRYRGQPIEIEFVLPGAGHSGGLPTRCEPVADADGSAVRPRCSVAFPQAVTAIDAAPDGRLVAVGVVDHPVSLWSAAPVQRASLFEDPPAEAAPPGHAPHPVAADAIAVRGDGLEVIVAYEKRLVRYSTRSSDAFSQLAGLPSIVRAVRWLGESRRVIVIGYYEKLARILNVTKRKLVRELAVGAPASGVAASPDASRVAVATESGDVFVFDTEDASTRLRLAEAAGEVLQVAFAGEHLAAVGNDGVLRLWDLDEAGVRARVQGLGPQYRMAVSSDGSRLATGGVDGRVHVYSLPALELVSVLDWHRTLVTGLAWAGDVLVTGDDRGRAAFWDLLP